MDVQGFTVPDESPKAKAPWITPEQQVTVNVRINGQPEEAASAQLPHQFWTEPSER